MNGCHFRCQFGIFFSQITAISSSEKPTGHHIFRVERFMSRSFGEIVDKLTKCRQKLHKREKLGKNEHFIHFGSYYGPFAFEKLHISTLERLLENEILPSMNLYQ